tara:strand:+ start:900 stop:1463 length:564 start_codon:yes stop_codon:yes gene_type:complete
MVEAMSDAAFDAAGARTKAAAKKAEKRLAKSAQKWKDRGRAGDKMLSQEATKTHADWDKEHSAAIADHEKDVGLLVNYGKDAPKSRSFATRRQGGGIARDRRDGLALGGRTRVAHQDDSKVLMQAGGYSGGLAESGRGTMAGELAPKGSMSVREAGEDMYELSKRRRGMQGGGAASSYNRPYNNQNK